MRVGGFPLSVLAGSDGDRAAWLEGYVRYLNLLETTCQIVRIPAYSVSRSKRLTKSPRLYWIDCGLASHLGGFSTAEAVSADPLGGFLVENLFLNHLLAWREKTAPRPEIHYWRTQSGVEVDFVIEQGRRLLPLEVKVRKKITGRDTKSLEIFLEEYPSLAPFGLVLYGGQEVLTVGRNILAVPLGAVLGL